MCLKHKILFKIIALEKVHIIFQAFFSKTSAWHVFAAVVTYVVRVNINTLLRMFRAYLFQITALIQMNKCRTERQG